MSRIGKKEINLPEGVKASLSDNLLTVSGPKGELNFAFQPKVEVKTEDDKVFVKTKDNDKVSKVLQGTTRQIIANMIIGVNRGWSKTVEIIGTGYRASLEEGTLILSLGYSHKLEVITPTGISFSVSENKITVSGPNKDLVGRTTAHIRSLRPPDSYKGKGIRYQGEKLKLKPGKAAKVGPGAGGAK